jgi:hypothetical protein
MSWRKAKALDTLLDQVDAMFPERSKESDGSIGNAEHSARQSDHNPDKFGIVRAIDITNDPDGEPDSRKLADALVASRDPRIKYIISNGQIISSKQQPWVWRPYHGLNAHKHHVHISVAADRGLGDDTTPWDLSHYGVHAVDARPAVSSQPELQSGAKGEAVKRLQLALRAHGEMIDVDEDFGQATERAVKNFQEERGLRPDGIVGPQTNAALGI